MMMKKQQGMTLFGMLGWVIGILLMALVIMRVVPVYIQDYYVNSSLNALNQLPPSTFSADSMANANMLRSTLMKHFDINGFTEFKPEQILIAPNGSGGFNVSIHYVIIRSLVYNVSLMFDFNDAVEVSIGSK